MRYNRRVGKPFDYEAGYNHVAQIYGWTFDVIDAMPFPRFFRAAKARPHNAPA